MFLPYSLEFNADLLSEEYCVYETAVSIAQIQSADIIKKKAYKTIF
jgi:hypothetical protein